jgi:hypothetical protein
MTVMPNAIAGVGAGWTTEFIEMVQVVLCHKSGSVQLWRR